MKAKNISILTALLMIAVILCGCVALPKTQDVETILTVYLPGDNAEGYRTEDISFASVTPEAILDELVSHGVLKAGTNLNSFSIEKKKGRTTLHMDLSEEFTLLLQSMGTSGEMMIMGSVVNTYLKAYNCDYARITSDGKIIETGHSIYDFPLAFYN